MPNKHILDRRDRIAQFIQSEMSKPSDAVVEFCKQRGYSERVCAGGLDYLLKTWDRVVRDILAGYKRLFDEFLNDMDCRMIINELLPIATDAERDAVLLPLSSLDRSFHEATVMSSSCIWGDDNAAKCGWTSSKDWWYYRVPRTLDFVEDVEAWPSMKDGPSASV